MSLRRGFRRLKRMVWLAAIVGGFVGVRKMAAARRAAPSVGPPATWPPLERTPPSEEPVAAVGDLATELDTASPTANVKWVAPVDGACPSTHPIKANDNSMIFHEPGERFYERTQAERCYVSAADAEADGYRAAKGAQP